MKNTALAKARIAACRLWPAATSAILSLVPVERRGLGTLAVDKHWRLYFDPEYLATVDDQTAAVIVLHEVSHLLLRHHERGGNATDWKLWNVATDCSVNFRLQAEGHTVPPEWMTPARFQLQGNLSAEQYYRHLEDQRDAQSQQQQPDPQATPDDEPDESPRDDAGASQGDQPELETPQQAAATDAADQAGEKCGEADQTASVQPGVSGSCADGQLKPWEDPPPAAEEDGPPVIEKHEQEQLIRRVAEAMEKGQGGGTSNWSSFVQDILHPRIDPKVLLSMAIRQAVDQVSGGHDDTSYRRPSRRPAVGGVIRPARVAVIPRICVIVDSSGSMDGRDLGYALGLIGKVLSGFRLRDGVQVMVGDTSVQTCEKVFDPKRLSIKGGGGTEMDRLIVAAARLEPRPQLIVVATDGYTDWPRENVGVPVVACLTRQSCRQSVPDWIKSIVLA